MIKKVSLCKIIQDKNPTDEEFIQYLKTIKKFNANEQEEFVGNSLLVLCSSRGMRQSVAYLLNKGANPNIANFHRISPLHWSCADANIEMTKNLLDFNADYNIKTNKNNLPIHNAITSGNLDMIMLLCEKMVELNDVKAINEIGNYIEENREKINSDNAKYKYNEERRNSLPRIESYINGLILSIKLQGTIVESNFKEIKKI